MRFMARCYPDGVTKPHIDDKTFKFDVTNDTELEDLLEDLREFVEDRFESWKDSDDWVES